MTACDWEGCTTAALPMATSTGHHLCEYHIAQATAIVRDATYRLQTGQQSPPQAPTRAARRPLGVVVPPIVLALVVLCTVAFPFRWPLSHVALMFIMFLVLVAWWGWIWGFGRPTR
jgi:TRAP-type mannitol/chloroaromatic compound transport system permease large subunit